jgi:hypothetical protein
MGRPPLGKAAMTSSERQQRFLQRLVKNAQSPDTAALQQRIAGLEQENSRLRRELAKVKRQARKPAGAPQKK